MPSMGILYKGLSEQCHVDYYNASNFIIGKKGNFMYLAGGNARRNISFEWRDSAVSLSVVILVLIMLWKVLFYCTFIFCNLGFTLLSNIVSFGHHFIVLLMLNLLMSNTNNNVCFCHIVPTR